MPRHYAGPRLFWSDLRQAGREGLETPEARPLARITANPRDCLAFASAHQTLVAASMSGMGPSPTARRIADLARTFGIDHLLRQPIRTLSGGETVPGGSGQNRRPATGRRRSGDREPLYMVEPRKSALSAAPSGALRTVPGAGDGAPAGGRGRGSAGTTCRPASRPELQALPERRENPVEPVLGCGGPAADGGRDGRHRGPAPVPLSDRGGPTAREKACWPRSSPEP